MSDSLDTFNLDRTIVSVRSLHDEPDDLAYWLTQPPERRLQAVEYLRESFHGHAYPSQRIERVFALTERE